MRRQRNCDGDTNPNFANEWAPDVRRCPWAYFTPDVWRRLDWWNDWKHYRALPYKVAGDILDQPGYVYEAIRHVETENASAQERAAKERIAAFNPKVR